MAKEKKGGLEVEDPGEAEVLDAGAAPAAVEGLTENILYATPAAAGTPSGASGTPAGAGDAKPGDAKPGEAKPGEAKPGEAKAGEGGEPAGEQPAWDKKRQERDTRHAEERRELRGQITAATDANTALAEEIRALREGRETAASAEENKELEAALSLVDQLGELSEPKDIVAAVKAVKQISLRVPKGGADAERMERIEQAVKSLAQNVQGLGENLSIRQGRDDLEGAMAELDEEFGAQFHNDAMDLAGEMLIKHGRSAEYPPTKIEKLVALRLAYTELAGKKAGGAKPTPKPKPLVPADAGAGGGLQTGGVERGSLNDVTAAMKAEGKLT